MIATDADLLQEFSLFVRHATGRTYSGSVLSKALKQAAGRSPSGTGESPAAGGQGGPFPVAAGLAVVADDTGRVLMLQRQLDPDDPNSGKWEFPGGRLDDGESPQEAAMREWEEETGLALPQGIRLSGEWPSGNGKYHGFVVRLQGEADLPLNCRAADGDPESGGWAAVAWVDPADLPHHNLRPALLGDIDEVVAAITKWMMLGVVTKGKQGGTCEPGQTAAKTGCIPAEEGPVNKLPPKKQPEPKEKPATEAPKDPRVGTIVPKQAHAAAVKKAKAKLANVPQPTEQERVEAEAGLAKLGANKYRRNLVGNTSDRRKRREKLLQEFGDGKVCPCIYCGLTIGDGTDTLEQDKIVTTAEGGRYRVPNLVPSCKPCNGRRGDMPFDEALKKVAKYAG